MFPVKDQKQWSCYVRQLWPPRLSTTLTRCSSTDGSRQVNKTETRKEQKNTANVLVNRKNVRRMDWKIIRQVTLLILASNCLTKPQSPVHMNTNIETYTSQHEVFSPCLDSHEAAAGVFARATFRDKDKNTQLHSGEYRYSVAEAKCVDTQAPIFPTVHPRSGIPTEGEPTDSSTQNTPTAAMTPTERQAREEGFCIEKVKEQVDCVMDRLDQRWLRDRNRNKSFVKIVADTRNNGEILIAESVI